jgi:predicted P-loop ATPase
MRSELTRVKAFLARKNDVFRPPYGRTTLRFPRQCVFAATTNRTDWNVDETGGRRWWPVRCEGKIDIAALERERDQIWAEAVHRYKSGALWYLGPELAAAAADEQEARYDYDAWDPVIWNWLMGDRSAFVAKGNPAEAYDVSIGEILNGAIGKKPEAWTRRDKLRVARILRLHGLEGFRKRLTDANGQPILRPDGTQEREHRYRWPDPLPTTPPLAKSAAAI